MFNKTLFVDETPKLQHFSAEVVQKEYCQAVKVIELKYLYASMF